MQRALVLTLLAALALCACQSGGGVYVEGDGGSHQRLR
jgi:hypothetical protein